MKMRRIPETELARITTKNEEEQRSQLRKLKSFRPPHTLNPFRNVIPDIMNVQYEMLGESSPTHWEVIENSILSSKETEDGKERNIAVALALFNFVTQNNIISHNKPIPRWEVGFGNIVEYWQPFYSIWNDRATFVHFDPRLSNPFTKDAMRFAFSLMHQRLRVDDPDFAEVGLTIFKFGKGDEKTRTVKIHSSKGIELYSRDQLNEMITLTYKLWAEELQNRRDDGRKATGTDNPMGF